MQCPVCPTTELKMSERQGVEIDHCPKCRGVWLDRGELDKIIERASVELAGPSEAPPRGDRGHAPPPPVHPASMYDSDDGKHRYGKKRKHWLMEHFD